MQNAHQAQHVANTALKHQKTRYTHLYELAHRGIECVAFTRYFITRAGSTLYLHVLVRPGHYFCPYLLGETEMSFVWCILLFSFVWEADARLCESLLHIMLELCIFTDFDHLLRWLRWMLLCFTIMQHWQWQWWSYLVLQDDWMMMRVCSSSLHRVVIACVFAALTHPASSYTTSNSLHYTYT